MCFDAKRSGKEGTDIARVRKDEITRMTHTMRTLCQALTVWGCVVGRGYSFQEQLRLKAKAESLCPEDTVSEAPVPRL